MIEDRVSRSFFLITLEIDLDRDSFDSGLRRSDGWIFVIELWGSDPIMLTRCCASWENDRRPPCITGGELG